MGFGMVVGMWSSAVLRLLQSWLELLLIRMCLWIFERVRLHVLPPHLPASSLPTLKWSYSHYPSIDWLNWWIGWLYCVLAFVKAKGSVDRSGKRNLGAMQWSVIIRKLKVFLLMIWSRSDVWCSLLWLWSLASGLKGGEMLLISCPHPPTGK